MVRSEELSLEAIGHFVAASEEIRFEADDRHQPYGWMERVLVQQEYVQLGKAARLSGNLVGVSLAKAALHRENAGLSRGAQVLRLIAAIRPAKRG
jgi:hypothetical protein